MTDLSPSQADAYRVAFVVWFGLRPGEARVLTELYAADGSPLRMSNLAHRTQLKAGAMGFHISHLRRALETEAIDSEPGAGYRLTESGMAECRAALWQMGEELRRAS